VGNILDEATKSPGNIFIEAMRQYPLPIRQERCCSSRSRLGGASSSSSSPTARCQPPTTYPSARYAHRSCSERSPTASGQIGVPRSTLPIARSPVPHASPGNLPSAPSATSSTANSQSRDQATISPPGQQLQPGRSTYESGTDQCALV